ncbi:MAG: glucose-6-phosphate isomerase [Hyphomicrobiaceae bacterium]
MVEDADSGAFRQTISGCMTAAVGQRGLSQAELSSWLERASAALSTIQSKHRERPYDLLNVARDGETAVAAVERAYARLANGARTIVFFGDGGSITAGQAIAQVGGWSIPGTTDVAQRKRPLTRFYGNLDPMTLQASLSREGIEGQRFVVSSKSGGTAGTLAQFVAALAAVQEAGLTNRIPEMFLAISDPHIPQKENGLRRLCRHFEIPVLEHPSGIGERFAALTCVGLLPAIARGLDARAILAGAQTVADNLLTSSRAEHVPAAVAAAVAVALREYRGVQVQVMMPYADRLAQFANWYVQLWAESLGKSEKGMTPIVCLGDADQLSHLHQSNDGPNEHYLTLLRVPTAGRGNKLVAHLASMAGLGTMAGRTVGDLIAAQTKAIPEVLRQAGRPVRLIDLTELNEFVLGSLIMHFIAETVIAGHLVGIDFLDQPAVELGQHLTQMQFAQEG